MIQHRTQSELVRATWWARATLSVVRWAMAGCMLSSPVVALAAQPIPAEAFFKPPAINKADLSPDGRYLAFTHQAGGRVGLFTIDLNQRVDDVKKVAHFADADIRNFHWVTSSRLIYDVYDLQSGSGADRRYAPGLFSAQFDGRDDRKLVERRWRPSITDGRPLLSLTWNHMLLHVPLPGSPTGGEAGAPEVIVGEMTFEGNDLVDLQPLWVNTLTRRTRALKVAGLSERVIRWWFAPNNVAKMALSRKGGRDTLHWFHEPRDGQEGRWVKLSEAPTHALPFKPIWVGTGDKLFVAHTSAESGEQVVSPYDFAAGRPAAPLVTVPGFDFEGQLIISEDGQRSLGVRVNADGETTVWQDPAYKTLQAEVDRALPGRINRIQCRRCTAPDAVVLVKSWSDTHPGQWLLRTSDTNSGQKRWQTLVANQQPGIDPARMATVEFERIKARDGRQIPVWLTRPANTTPQQALPAVVLVHGGPWVRQGALKWQAMAQFLASRGYLVIEPEFRGSAGYGQEHLEAGNRQWGQAMQDDVSDALLWARQQGIANDKACIAGGSYGGYSSLMGLIKTPELFRCASAWFAVTDLMLFVKGSWWVADDVSDIGRQHLLPERVGDPEKDQAMLVAQSPVTHADRLKAPLQLVWGAEDLRVPLAHGHRLRSEMRKAGLEPEWVVYDGEGHGLRKLENRVDWAQRLEAFLAKHLK